VALPALGPHIDVRLWLAAFDYGLHVSRGNGPVFFGRHLSRFLPLLAQLRRLLNQRSECIGGRYVRGKGSGVFKFENVGEFRVTADKVPASFAAPMS